ncbi:MAG: dTMP kinase [Candidatus Heimdallarchaeota archaeon]
MNHGVFIVVEGIDGAGGETLSNNIVHKCNQRRIPCLKLKYPDYTSPWGKIIKDYLRGTLKLSPVLLFLTYASDQLKDQKRIETFRQQGGIVICDRYVTSAIAYESSLGVPYTKAVQLAQLLQFERPNFIFYLDISPDVSIQRKRQEKGKLDIHETNFELLTNVRKTYQTMSETNILGEWISIDATKTPEEIFKRAWEKIITK